MNYKIIISYSILVLFGGIMFYLSGIEGMIQFIISLVIYTFIFFGLHVVWKKIRKKSWMPLGEFAKYFLERVAIFLLVITGIIGGGSFLLNEVFPAPMPEYTLSNGEKTVVFQGMSHIGTQDFYNTVAENLKKHKQEGGVYFFEGVKPGSAENLEKFNNAIGIQFDDDLYENFSKLYGVNHQDNRMFLGLVNDLDFNVDLTMDEIVEEYDKKIAQKQDGEEFENKLPMDANEIILESLSQLNERELKILVYINQAILNFIIGSDSTQDFLTNNFANVDLFDVILGKRNEVLTKAIVESEYDNIYITYGLLHFDGVFELLKQNDEKWKIVSEKYLYPIQ